MDEEDLPGLHFWLQGNVNNSLGGLEARTAVCPAFATFTR